MSPVAPRGGTNPLAAPGDSTDAACSVPGPSVQRESRSLANSQQSRR
jgi:hypothetical protein